MYNIYKLELKEDIVKLYDTLKKSNYIYNIIQKENVDILETYKLLKGKVIYIAVENDNIIAFIMFERPYLNLIHTHCCFLGRGYNPKTKSVIFKDILIEFKSDYNYKSFLGYIPFKFKKTINFWKKYCTWSTLVGEVPSGLVYNNEDTGGYIFHVQLNGGLYNGIRIRYLG